MAHVNLNLKRINGTYCDFLACGYFRRMILYKKFLSPNQFIIFIALLIGKYYYIEDHFILNKAYTLNKKDTYIIQINEYHDPSQMNNVQTSWMIQVKNFDAKSDPQVIVGIIQKTQEIHLYNLLFKTYNIQNRLDYVAMNQHEKYLISTSIRGHIKKYQKCPINQGYRKSIIQHDDMINIRIRTYHNKTSVAITKHESNILYNSYSQPIENNIDGNKQYLAFVALKRNLTGVKLLQYRQENALK